MFSELAIRAYFFIELFVSDNVPSYLKCPIIDVPLSLESICGYPGWSQGRFQETLTYIVI